MTYAGCVSQARFALPLETELQIKSNHRIGRFSDVSKSKQYHDRIQAIDFSLAVHNYKIHRRDRYNDLAGDSA